MSNTKQRGRLLILDDDRAIARTISVIVEATGMESRSTTTSEEFFRELGEWDPTHIALDLVMPGMDGVEVIRQLGTSGCRARIIITSGLGGRVLEAARLSATEHGLNIAGILPKPFSPATLRGLLSEAAQIGATKNAPVTQKKSAALDITADVLRRALEQKELFLAFQPKIECATGVLAGFEALVRWQHPEVGVVMPDRFIPLAEECGLIDDLTAQVIDQGLRWLAECRAAPAASLSLNLSARNLTDLHLADRIAAQCQQFAIEPGRLILEITESCAAESSANALDLLTRFRMKGFQLSIDDFGTGFSSMVQLTRLPFSEVKVDKTFVISAAQSEKSRTVIKSIVELGQSLGLRIAAEGVEDAKALDFLRNLGCDFAQGYLISRAIAGDAVPAWIAAWDPAAVGTPRVAPS
jgi:EAL domain-containing protein (putative c-di-GMP-specific phosphodiesterase class I)/FixJ family two-component response regulator